MKKFQKGFTLIEILVVIGILAVLFTIALVAINPQRQFQQANDVKRRSDVNTLLNAITQYAADNRGTLPAGIAQTTTDISDTGVGVAFCTDVVTRYLAGLPQDPRETQIGGGTITVCATTPWDTGYTVLQSASDNRVTVSAVGELTGVISVTR